jgi:hypothetical protein
MGMAANIEVPSDKHFLYKMIEGRVARNQH